MQALHLKFAAHTHAVYGYDPDDQAFHIATCTNEAFARTLCELLTQQVHDVLIEQWNFSLGLDQPFIGPANSSVTQDVFDT